MSAAAAPSGARPRPRREPGRSLPAAGDALLAVVFLAVSAWVLALDVDHALSQTALHWSGTDGLFPQDQLQYLAWIRDASQHVLVSDLWVTRPTAHDFLAPLVAISGGLVALGMAPWLSLLLWQIPAVVGLFLAARALVHATVPGRWGRIVALGLGLFACLPPRTATFFVGDAWMPFWSWGYPWGALALAAAIAALLRHAVRRATPGWGLGAAALGALAAWIHPWQGELLVLLVLTAELGWRALGDRAPLRRSIVLVLATAIPLLYYAALSHFDTAWHAAAVAAQITVPVSWVAWQLLPLLPVALLGYRRRPRSYLGLAVMLWPPVAAVMFVLAEHGIGEVAPHALLGLTLALAVLAVDGLSGLRRPGAVPRGVAVTVVGLWAVVATVPGTVAELGQARTNAAPQANATTFTAQADASALRFLAADHRPGAVLSDPETSLLVPAATGRAVYDGDSYWSQPHGASRSQAFAAVIGGVTPDRAAALLRSTGARFVLVACGTPARAARVALAAITVQVRRFGCATVIAVRSARP